MKQRYQKYKESGVDWLGQVPEHWGIKKFKHYYASSMGNTILKEDLSDDASIPVYSATEYVEILGYIDNPNVLLHNDDFIIPARGNSIGHVKLVQEECTSTQTTIYAKKLSLNALNPKYAYWYQIGHRKKLYEFDNTAIPQLTVKQVKDNPITIPPVAEQQSIATYLGRETSRIDALIQKKERLIELLKEKRIALITQAVTKGLDPNVPMKDSGIEWLGEVPEHWEIKRIKHIARRIQTGCTPPTSNEQYYEDGTIQWFGPSSFTEDLYLSDSVKIINVSSVTDGVARLFEKGSIMLVGIGATIGKIAQITMPSSCNQQITVITLKRSECDPDYYTYLLKTMETTIRGIAPSATLAILDQGKIGSLSVIKPPLLEQVQVAEFLSDKLSKLAHMMSTISGSIHLLKEYRSSLIHHAVTGKIDLRGYDVQAQ